MKKLLTFFVIIFLAFASMADAAPFLVCDPPPAEQQITSYNIYKDAVLEGTYDGEILNYDLAGITPGAYDWTAEACNVWGCEITPDPYISPSAATSPLNLNGIP
jgi:hypothetical protein